MANLEKMRAFKEEVQLKINDLLEEFSEGKLNREQFHAIYERYNGQMELADKALNGQDIPWSEQEGGTIFIREKFMGKARGMMIVANQNGNIIETLGNFGVDFSVLAPVLSKLTQALQTDSTVERVVKRLGEHEWLLFAGGKYTTVVTLFENEPSSYQTLVIQRMHEDFENANYEFFKTGQIDSSKLVYPFFSFVQRSMRKS